MDFDRLRGYRLARVKEQLEASDLGAVLLFETSNIRYATSTHIGYWAFNKGERYALITRTGPPRIWDFGSAAKAHRLQLPQLYDVTNSVGGNTGLQGAISPAVGLQKRAAEEIRSVLKEDGVGDMPLGVDLAETSVFLELQRAGIDVRDGQQVMMLAREIKNPDEIMLLTQACAMVDGVYQDIFEFLKPGVRESDVVALAHKRLFEMGSEFVEAINSIAGERCSPHPHVFSDRLIRPGDQAYFDIIHVNNGYRTCYYRTFVVGRATTAQRDAFKRSREWMDAAIDLVKPGAPTRSLAAVWPKAEEFGFAGRDGRVRAAVRPRRRRRAARTADHQPAQLVRGTDRAEGGHAVRPRDVLPGLRRSLRRAHRGGDRRDRRRARRSSRSSRAKSSWSPTSTDRRIRGERGGHRWRTSGPPRHVPDDAGGAPVREAGAGPVPRGAGQGHVASRARQEAVAAGFAAALRTDDLVFCTYRGHVHTLLRGAPMGALMAELLGRATGICGGKGGSMHLTDVEHGAMGSYAIVGAHMPIAAGAAWAAQERETGQVVVCFFGDGTTNIGAFHEALNMAVVWKLPVVFVCENNLYMEYTPIGEVTAVEHPGRRSRVRVRPRVHHRRRERRRRGPRDRDARRGSGARRAAALARRGEDVPPRRSLARRPRQVPAGRRGRRRGSRATRSRRTASGCSPTASRPPRSTTSSEALGVGRPRDRGGEGGPVPEPDALETELWADGGSAWRN